MKEYREKIILTNPDEEVTTEREIDPALQQEVLDALEALDIIDYGEEGELLVDIVYLRALSYVDLRKQLGDAELFTSRHLGNRSKRDTLFLAFKDRKVISTDEYYADDVRKTKDLFYSPQSDKEALDINAIKRADFYMGAWEMQSQGSDRHQFHPGMTDSALNMSEVTIAALTYHPSYGNGSRDKDGVLQVFDPRKKSYGPVTAEVFTRGFGYTGERKGQQGGIESPRQYLRGDGMQLAEAGLLRPEDFKVQSGSSTAEEQRIYRRKRFGARGSMTIDSIRYYFGSALKGKDVLVYQLSPTTGGIVENIGGKEVVTHIFDLTTKKDGRLQKRDSTLWDAGKAVTNLRPVAALDAVERERMGGYAAVIAFTEDIEQQAGVNMSQLDTTTQLHAFEAATVLLQDKERIINFASEFGLDGMQAFLSAEHGTEMGERVLVLAEHAKRKEQVHAVFREYASVARIASRLASKIEDQPEQADRIREIILRKGKEFLVAGAQIASAKRWNESQMRSIADAMQEYRRYVEEYISIPPQDHPTDLYSVPSEFAVAQTARMEARWYKEIQAQREGGSSLYDSARLSEAFYAAYVEMNTDASETTGDTARERSRLMTFIDKLPQGSSVFDAGCGDGERITEYVAAARPDLRITGVDLLAPEEKSHMGVDGNVLYKQGDLTNLEEFPNAQFDAVMSNWSVVCDILARKDQIQMFREFSRILQEGGQLYIDIPWLEGGDGSWEEAAKAFQQEHPGGEYPYGMIEAPFQKEDGTVLVKKFDIYPYQELVSLLEQAGLEVVNPLQKGSQQARGADSPYESPGWRTGGEMSKPRITIIARKKVGGAQASNSLLFGIGLPSHLKNAS